MMIKKLKLFLVVITLPALALLFATYFSISHTNDTISATSGKAATVACSATKACTVCTNEKSCDHCSKCKEVCDISIK